MIFEAIIILCVLVSAGLAYFAILPIITKRYENIQDARARAAGSRLEDMFVWIGHKKLILILGLSPVLLGIIFFILSGNHLLIVAGVIIGFITPMLVINQIERLRKLKFKAQLIDALSSLSQSLKAGLSFLQAIEVLVEEMPAPISQEFALLLKENKMGVPFEESFERMNNKMNLEDLNLITTAILLARETGGNLTDIFINLSDSMRQKNKIADQVNTLTTQARWQGIIMSLLPVFFAIFIFNINPNFLDIMWESETGRLLLFWCVISEVIGAFLLYRLSRVEV